MPTTLLAVAYDLSGGALQRTHESMASVERLLTPAQAQQLALGLDVTIISRRGRVDYRRADAPALRNEAPW